MDWPDKLLRVRGRTVSQAWPAICRGIGMQKYTVLGISLCDYGVREALRNTDGFLHSGGLNTVAYISGAILAQASKEEDLKRCVERIDMTICAEADVLEAVGIAGRNRVREIDEQSYLRELLRKLNRNRNSVYLLAETAEGLEGFKDIITEYQENLFIRGCGAYEDFDRQPERLVNALNDLTPDVVISCMPWMGDFRLTYEYGQYVNAKLWVSLPLGIVNPIRKTSFFTGMSRRLKNRLFTKQVNEYNNSRKPGDGL